MSVFWCLTWSDFVADHLLFLFWKMLKTRLLWLKLFPIFFLSKQGSSRANWINTVAHRCCHDRGFDAVCLWDWLPVDGGAPDLGRWHQIRGGWHQVGGRHQTRWRANLVPGVVAPEADGRLWRTWLGASQCLSHQPPLPLTHTPPPAPAGQTFYKQCSWSHVC